MNSNAQLYSVTPFLTVSERESETNWNSRAIIVFFKDFMLLGFYPQQLNGTFQVFLKTSSVCVFKDTWQTDGCPS